MRLSFVAALCASLVLAAPALAEPTKVDVRVLARGAKFMGGYTAPVRVVMTDADTGEVLARGLTAGTTGDTGKIMGGSSTGSGTLSSDDSAAFRTTLDIDHPRRVTLSVTGPLSQPQATTTATSTQWILPGRHLTAGDGWRMELPGLIVDLATPVAYQVVARGASVPVRAGVTMLCGCPISADGPWRLADTEVEAYLTVDGGAPRRYAMTYDPADSLFSVDVPTDVAGVHELEIRAWMGPGNNAGVARSAFFVR